MNILAEINRVVIYTPAEDFFYNTVAGSTFVVYLVTALIAVFAGYTLSGFFKFSKLGNVLGWCAGVGIVMTEYALLH